MEDFVPFEISKKLKEKGFREECLCHYIGKDLFYNIESPIANNQLWFSHNKFDNIWHRDNYDAPTISQGLKWLFDEKQLFVNIDCNICDKFGLFFTIYKKGEETWEACGFDDNYYNKPEETSLAAIEYVLDNLI